MKRKIAAVLLAVSLASITFVGCDNATASKKEGLDLSAEDGDYDYVDWDGNELLSLLPDPNSSKVKSKQVDSNTARLIVYEVSKSGFNKYIELCADNGFRTDSKSVSDDTGAMYKATNDTGYLLTLAYDPDDKAMGIRVDAPDSSDQEEVDSTPTPTEETTPEPTPTEGSTPEPTPTEEVANEETDDADVIDNLSKSQKPASGVRQELKDYLDAYEDFAKEYAEFMKKYTDINTVANYDLDQDYKKLEDKAKKFSDAESKLYDNFDDLNSDEWDYFYDRIGDIYDEMYDY